MTWWQWVILILVVGAFWSVLAEIATGVKEIAKELQKSVDKP